MILSILLMCTLLSRPALAEIKDETSARTFITSLQNSTKAEEISAWAKTAKEYPFKEVVQSLIQLAQKEINKLQTGREANTFILNESLNSIAEMNDGSMNSEIEFLINNLKAVKSALVAQVGEGSYRWTKTARELVSDSLLRPKRRSALHEFAKPVGTHLPGEGPFDLKTALEELTSTGKYKYVENGLKKEIKASGPEAAALGIVSNTLISVLSGSKAPIFGRDHEAKEVMRTFLWLKGGNPVLLGPAGAGKTTVMEKVAQEIDRINPADPLYGKLAGTQLIETSPARISRLAQSNDQNSQAAALESFFDSVLIAEKVIGRPIAIFLDELQTMSDAQVEASKRYIDSEKTKLKFAGASTDKEFLMKFKSNDAILRRLHPVAVEELGLQESYELIKQVWLPKVEAEYKVQLDHETVRKMVELAAKLRPDQSRVDTSIKVIQQLAIFSKEHNRPQIGRPELMEFLKVKMGLPVDVNDPLAVQNYLDHLSQDLAKEVIAQERMIKDSVDVLGNILVSEKKKVGSVLYLGPTGVGKTQLGISLAKLAFKNPAAFLELDGNAYKDGGYSINSLPGAPNGVISSDKTSGVLPEWLVGAARNGGVLLINEAEKAHKDFAERLMEFLDKGTIQAGDGKTYHGNKILVIFTSNRGDGILYPNSMRKWTEEELSSHLSKFSSEDLKKICKESIKGEASIPDPILARIDRFSPANPVTEKTAIVIGRTTVKAKTDEIFERWQIKLNVDETWIKNEILSQFDMTMGFRPVAQMINSKLESLVKKAIRAEVLKPGGSAMIKLEGDKSLLISEKGQIDEATSNKLKTNFLDDPKYKHLSQNLVPSLSKHVIGQTQAVESIASSIKAQRAFPDENKRAVSMLLVGTTGVGKTEIGRGLSEVLYGSSSRVGLIAMGEVSFEGHFNKHFGVPKGYVGGQEVGTFEQFMIDNPDGGVLVFDEISNMGGGKHDVKEALMKRLYAIIDEPVWASENTGRKYDLTKYTFLFTGNDLEGQLQNLPSDDLRIAAWKELNHKEKIRSFLRRTGWTEAFLGRMADVVLMKPLEKHDVELISLKFMSALRDQFERKGIQIEFSADFQNKLVDAFFTHSQGARSIRSIVETRLKEILTSTAVELRDLGLDVRSLKVDMYDTFASKNVAQGGQAREVKIVIQNLTGKVVKEADFTEYAAPKFLKTRRDGLLVSYHEIGHALVNDPKLTGQGVDFITIKTQGDMGGYARYKEIRTLTTMNRKAVVNKVASLLAGGLAQSMAGFGFDSGWTSDIDKAKDLITKALKDWGVEPELVATAPGRGYEIKFTQYYQTIFAEAREQAQQSLLSNWQTVRVLVGALFAKGEMTGAEFEKYVQPRDSSEWYLSGERVKRASAVRCERVLLQ